MSYTIADIMVVALARQIQNGYIVHVGASTLLGAAAASLALATHAPNAEVLAVSLSGYRSQPYRLTISLHDALACQVSPPTRVTDIYTHVERAEGCEVEPVMPTQVDRYGNVNMTVIGDPRKPKVRLPGGAGVDSLAVMLTNGTTYYTTRHNRKTFVEKVDFVSGPGYLDGSATARERAGIIGSGGPRYIISNLGHFDWATPTREMRVVTLHPGVTKEEVALNTGFPVLGLDGDIPTTPLPTQQELELLRTVIDPLELRMLEFLPARERRERIREIVRIEMEEFSHLSSAPRVPGYVPSRSSILRVAAAAER